MERSDITVVSETAPQLEDTSDIFFQEMKGDILNF